MACVITLTTDFGLADAYAAAVKGVILGINPQAVIIDICHLVKPQNIAQAAFILNTSYAYFPRDTVHVVVVDPGVGTERRAIILRAAGAYFVGPDNGVFSYVIDQYCLAPVFNEAAPRQVELNPKIEAVSITRPEFWRQPTSTTFHGRDIFGPVAAYLSSGRHIQDFGEPIKHVTMLSLQRPHLLPDGSLIGRVLHIDGFGNLITNVKAEQLPQDREKIVVEVGEHTITGLSRTYADSDGLLALIGSSGYLEISLNGGNASSFLSAVIDTDVTVKPLR